MIDRKGFYNMTSEEIDKIVTIVAKKIEDNEILTDFEDLVQEEIKLAKKENREISRRAIEEYKFWMD